MDFEAALLQVRVANVRVIAGEPVQRPASRRSESHCAARHTLLAHLELDLKLRRAGERNPHFARESPAPPTPGGEDARRPHQPPAAVGHTGAGGGGLETGDGDAHEVVAAVGLLIQHRGDRFNDDGGSGER